MPTNKQLEKQLKELERKLIDIQKDEEVKIVRIENNKLIELEQKYNLTKNRLNTYNIHSIKDGIAFCPKNSAILVRDTNTGLVYAVKH